MTDSKKAKIRLCVPSCFLHRKALENPRIFGIPFEIFCILGLIPDLQTLAHDYESQGQHTLHASCPSNLHLGQRCDRALLSLQQTWQLLDSTRSVEIGIVQPPIFCPGPRFTIGFGHFITRATVARSRRMMTMLLAQDIFKILQDHLVVRGVGTNTLRD